MQGDGRFEVDEDLEQLDPDVSEVVREEHQRTDAYVVQIPRKGEQRKRQHVVDAHYMRVLHVAAHTQGMVWWRHRGHTVEFGHIVEGLWGERGWGLLLFLLLIPA